MFYRYNGVGKSPRFTLPGDKGINFNLKLIQLLNLKTV